MQVDHILESGRISKKDICNLLGLVHPGGQSNLPVLKANYFTEDLLIELNLNNDNYRKIRIFDKIQTKIIIGRLKLNFISPKLTYLIR